MCPPLGKQPRKWISWGPKAAVGEGSPTAGMGCPVGHTWLKRGQLPSSVWT